MTTPTDPHRLLALMQADMAEQPAQFQPTPFWRGAAQHIATELAEGGFENFRRLPSPRNYFVPSYGPPGNLLAPEDVAALEAVVLKSCTLGSKKHATLMSMLQGEAWALADYRVFLAGDRADLLPDLSRISESDIGNPPDAYAIDGRRFSRSMLNCLHGLVFLKQQLGERVNNIKRVLEIGGGYGTLGEILHGSGGGYSYVDVDIAPTSAVASHYLAQQDGLDLIDYGQTRGQGRIDVPAPGRQMVLCPWQLPKLQGTIDLLWNFISFQEMEPEVVRFYLSEGERLGARYVLLRNLREGKQKRQPGSPVGVDAPILGADYDSFLPGYELLATNVHPFGYRTIDGYHSELRLYARR